MITRLLCLLAGLALLGCQHPCTTSTTGDAPRVSNQSFSFVSENGTHYGLTNDDPSEFAIVSERGSDASKVVLRGNAYAGLVRVYFTIRDVPVGAGDTSIPTTQVDCEVYAGNDYTPERNVATAKIDARRLSAECHSGWCDQDLDADIAIDGKDLHIAFTVVMKGAPAHAKEETCTDIGIDTR